MVPGVTTSVDRTGCERLNIRNKTVTGSRERVVRLLHGLGTGTRYGVHANNLLNLARGIVERVFYVVRDGGLKPPPGPTFGAWNKLHDIRSRLVRCLTPTARVDLDDYPELYTGRKRAVYQRAVDSLKQRGIRLCDAFVSTFLKAEKINFSAKADPAPRVIQPRSPRYNVEVGRYLKKFECELVRGFRRCFGYDVIMKGKNASEVATCLRGDWEAFKCPVAIGLDASRFDQHVSVEALKFEHGVYNSVFQAPYLARLLKMQLHNRGYARIGDLLVKYETDGCRMSGDMNTGMGNCLLMSLMVLSYCESVGLNARLANNGDDCVLFMEAADIGKMAGIDEWMLGLGFTLTTEAPVYTFERVVFCQAQPVLTQSGWRMTRDPSSAMNKDLVSLLSWENELDFRRWCYAIGTCGKHLSTGVPIWESFYNGLMAEGVVDERALAAVEDSGLGWMSRSVKGCSITPECRASFYNAFGILPDLQLEAEAPFVIDPTLPTAVIDPKSIPTEDNILSTFYAHGQVTV